MDKLYDIYFHFNHYKEEWNAVPRDKIVDYHNGTLKKGIVKTHTNFNKLINIIKTIK